MGNCCSPASSTEWDGEDWSFLTDNSKNTSSGKVFDQVHGEGLDGLCLRKVQKEKLMEALINGSPLANGKVKIRISKKELGELLESQQNVDKKQVVRASAEQVLLRLKNVRNHDTRHRFWRPVLENIPEVN